MNIITFKELAQRIEKFKPKHHRRIIAIDGGGGAGKTTFATCLQKTLAGSCIVKIDDFYRPPQLRSPVISTEIINPNFDWDRFRTLVFDAAINNKDIAYQLYDFDKGILSDKIVQVPREATIIVEGVWSMQSVFIGLYDYRIWLEAPAEIRLERGVSRDGEEFRQVWEQEWIPIDESYRNTQQPQLRADCIIDSVQSDFQDDSIVIN
jgi:uridine kinase